MAESSRSGSQQQREAEILTGSFILLHLVQVLCLPSVVPHSRLFQFHLEEVEFWSICPFCLGDTIGNSNFSRTIAIAFVNFLSIQRLRAHTAAEPPGTPLVVTVQSDCTLIAYTKILNPIFGIQQIFGSYWWILLVEKSFVSELPLELVAP